MVKGPISALPIVAKPGSEPGAFVSEMFKQSIQSRFDLRARVEPGPEDALRVTLSGKCPFSLITMRYSRCPYL